ncbi:universal stress protein [Pandoraea apista]|uniref:Universal stress protein n=2 Tax=Pandoraea apista TaxID=93218 RepID=A0A5E5PBY2_9BURK|nr:universal stress protein [Pandoraea apista]AJZ74880.1 hypothetical protein SG18_26910 [Pandoraea apista]AKH74080.1 hypothetical protein XM39_20360 [Pandoraea apista]AKI62628.1 hypothetical protein AA956_13675 [Pandoraea apista]AVF40903.1 universal stress protein [Pandoraea apista]OXS88515.1 hypothetical protein B7H01_22485 [Pandoraea apista]
MPNRILLAMDGSETSWHALSEAIRFAMPDDVVRAIGVVDDPFSHYQAAFASHIDLDAVREGMIAETQLTLTDAYRKLQDEGLQADTRSIDLRAWGGTIADAIVREAERWQADLLILGTHGRRGIRRLMIGSVAEQVLRQAHRPVMLVTCQSSAPTNVSATAATSMKG